jgi:hypothetical protein
MRLRLGLAAAAALVIACSGAEPSSACCDSYPVRSWDDAARTVVIADCDGVTEFTCQWHDRALVCLDAAGATVTLFQNKCQQ